MKAIFFDIDGTLVPLGKGYMPASTIHALQELQKKGILLFIASGRPKAHLKSIAKEFEEYPWDGYVLFNGQYCMDSDGTVFHDHPFDPECIEKLVPYVKENHIPCTFFEMEYMYATQYDDTIFSHRSIPVEDPERAYTHTLYQVGAYIRPEEDPEFVAHAPGLKSARWTDVFADIIPEDGGKPEGIRRMLERHGLTREECMAFGDGGNDITMLEYAGIGVAMGNAKEEVKKHADYITLDCENDGIPAALRHFGLID